MSVIMEEEQRTEEQRTFDPERAYLLAAQINAAEIELELCGGISAARRYEEAHGGISYAGECVVRVMSRALSPQDPSYRNLPA